MFADPVPGIFLGPKIYAAHRYCRNAASKPVYSSITFLPGTWKDGEIKGLKARGNLTVDMKWKDGKVINYSITGNRTTKVDVYVNSNKEEVQITTLGWTKSR